MTAQVHTQRILLAAQAQHVLHIDQLLPNGGHGFDDLLLGAPQRDLIADLVKVAQRLQHPLGAFTLLEVTIKTGRTHQIRVHLASAGHPIAGDAKYGDFEQNKALAKAGLKRMFLHAWQLQFTHPASTEAVALQADLPLDLAQWVDACTAP